MLNLSSVPKTRGLALLSLFSVLYSLLRLVPTFPMIGVTGTFSMSDVLAPIYGIILGPFIGGGSIVLGTFLAIAFGRPAVFLGLDFLPATIGAVSLGFLVKRKFIHVTGLYVLLLGLFLTNPLSLIFVQVPNGSLVPYNWFHILALAILISPISRQAINWVLNPSVKYLAPGLVILCFIGTMAQHLTGGLVFEYVFGTFLRTIPPSAWSGIWTTTFYVYPLERIIIIALSTLIGSALITTLRKSNVISQNKTEQNKSPKLDLSHISEV